MAWFNNLRIQVKLLVAFAICSALTVAVGYMGLSTNSNTQGSLDDATHTALPSLAALASAREDIAWAERDTNRSTLESDPKAIAADAAAVAADLKDFDTVWGQYKALPASDAELKATADYDSHLAELKGYMNSALTLAQKNTPTDDAAAADIIANKLAPFAESTSKTLDDLSTLQLTQAEDASNAASAASSRATTILIVLIIGAIAIGMGAGYYISRRVKNDVGAVKSRMESLEANCLASLEAGIKAVEAGDLAIGVKAVTSAIDNPGKDELGQMATTANRMIEKLVSTIGSYNGMRLGLSEIVGGVRSNATTILQASEQLRESSDQMASATGQIAVAINEVTRAAVSLSGLSQESAREVEQVAAGSQQVAAAAQSNAASASESKGEAARMSERILTVSAASEEVAKAADESRTAAIAGQESVGKAVSAMEAIATAVARASGTVDQLGEYGKQIGDIVQVIDEIAAQTNLLALNAAIEAARAGEQGRGFAVVAENVRGLAERSSESTKEIATLIAKVQAGTVEAVDAMSVGVKDVQEGREITTQAGVALERILSSVEQSASRAKDISDDMRGLRDGAERIVGSAETIAASASESATGASTMATGTTRVTEAIMQVSATSEETSASAEEVSASTEELSAQSEELAATANQMKDLAQQLNSTMARFKLA